MPLDVEDVAIEIDRNRALPITSQITNSLRTAILERRLKPGARLPSWVDMATQLGVSRGTVKSAYETLASEMLVISAGAAGTHVADREIQPLIEQDVEIARPLLGIERGFSLAPLPFQMGVPAQDAFPAKLWSRVRTRAVRDDAMAPVGPPDPRGHPELRTEIASYLAITRGVRCVPDQIILTSGYKNGLCLTLLTLQAQGRSVWMEEPGFPMARMGLELAGVTAIPIPVDAEGVRVDIGVTRAPDAVAAVVTPSQQAPLGIPLSSPRRRALLDWAKRENSWVIEDDYLSELQLSGRASPPLAADDPEGRVIHIGSFGKTLSPALGLGFVVAPMSLAERFGAVAGLLMPAPNSTTQLALAQFMADGHYLRHLRHMKQLYRERRDALHARLGDEVAVDAFAGLALLARLPKGTDDMELADRALERGIAPLPLSVWFSNSEEAEPGFLLCVTNLRKGQLEKSCEVLADLIRTSA